LAACWKIPEKSAIIPQLWRRSCDKAEENIDTMDMHITYFPWIATKAPKGLLIINSK
jgi:hypothetical protein